jgi:hypothetical protein
MSYTQRLAGLGQDKSGAEASSAQVLAGARSAVAQLNTMTATQLRMPNDKVRLFQQAYGHGLTADGIYGPATRRALALTLNTSESNLPAVPVAQTPSGGGYVPTTTTPVATPTEPTVETASDATSWVVPVAVVGTVVAVAGYMIVRRRRAVAANRRRRAR